MKKLYSGLLGIEYGQFYIDVSEPTDAEQDYLYPDRAFQGHENGICGSAMPGKIFLWLAITPAPLRLM